MDRGRDLDLRGCGLGLLALLETRLDVLTVCVDVRVIHKLIEPLHIYQVISLVDKDVSVLYLSLHLLKLTDLLVSVASSLHLIEVQIVKIGRAHV